MALPKQIIDLAENEALLSRIEAVVRDGVGVVPFVGAGLSRPYGFPLWREFLLDLAGKAVTLGTQGGFEEAIAKRLDDGEFEEAAGDIESALSPEAFWFHFTHAFGPGKLAKADLSSGVAAILPHLAVGPVITTNFDQLLEHAFDLADRGFGKDVVWGNRIQKAYGKITQLNARVLIKLHGDVEDPEDRILTLEEYRHHYGNTSPTEVDRSKGLPTVLDRILSRPALFVGCSLDKDRTIAIVTGLAREIKHADLLHYAILEQPRNNATFLAKRKTLLAQKIGPIWFPPGEFGLIEVILQHLADLVPDKEPVMVPDGDDARQTPTNLRFPHKKFIGRDSEIDALIDFMREDRFATLHGPAGSGKTEMAIQVARGLLDHFTDGVYLVRLADLRQAQEIPGKIAEVLTIQEQAEKRPTDALVDHLKRRHCLLVLDNCEHLIDACRDIVDHLLERTERVAILTTSRQLLDLEGESVRPVGPLAFPAEGAVQSVDDLRAYEATELFLERAHDRNPSLEYSDEDVSAIVRICTRLDGIPLAIEFAAARLPGDSVQTIAKGLEDRFAYLYKKARGTTKHHKTLEAAVGWSYELLTPEQQQLLRGVSAFVGGWSGDAVREIVYEGTEPSPGVDRRLEELADRSVIDVVPSDEGRRYSMLETLQEYGLARLDECGEWETMEQRHLDWAVHLVEHGGPKLVLEKDSEWLGHLDREQPNVRAALARALAKDRVELALRLGAWYWRVWELRGYLHEGRRFLGELLARDGVDTFVAPWARVISGAGILAYRQGDSSSAFDHFAKAYEIESHRDPVDKIRLAECHNDLGIARQQRGDLDGAKHDYRESSQLFEEVVEALESSSPVDKEQVRHARRQAAIARYNTGNMAYEGADLQTARHALTQAATDFERLDMMSEFGFPLTALGRTLTELGEHEEAKERLDRAFEVRESRDIKGGMAASLHGLARLALARGDTTEARDLLGRAIRLQREVGNEKGTALSLESFALHAVETGTAERTAVLLAAAAALLAKLRLPERPVDRPALDHARAFAATAVSAPATGADALAANEAIDFALGETEAGS